IFGHHRAAASACRRRDRKALGPGRFNPLDPGIHTLNLAKGRAMTITLEDARRVIAGAEKRADEIGQPENIAVVDGGGNLVAHARMDGAWIGSVDISINKAWTARAFDMATKDLKDDSQSGGALF